MRASLRQRPGRPLDATDRAVINRLQQGFPIVEAPYAAVARELGISEETLITRLSQLLAEGFLSRFGPLYNAEAMGGGLTLAAMGVPASDFDRVAAIVNGFPQVAHNYAREHELNMWFVLATEAPAEITIALAQIAAETGYPVYNMPRQRAFSLELYFRV